MGRTHTLSCEIPAEAVVVAGAGSGIGRAVAVELTRLGIDAYLLGRRADALAKTAAMAEDQPGRCIPFHCDVRDPARIDEVFARIENEHGGEIRGLVNCAAAMNYTEARHLAPAQFADVVSTILQGCYNLVHRWATPLLDADLDGAAVLLTSNLASKGAPGIAHSCAGKAGVEGLMKSLAREWGPHGLRLNVIGPGPFPVEKSERMWSEPAINDRIKRLVALGRLGVLPEIVGPILFLLSDAAAYITGQVLVVDGGMSLTDWYIATAEIDRGYNNTYAR